MNFKKLLVVAGLALAIFCLPEKGQAQSLGFNWDESATGTWDEFDLPAQLGSGDVFVGNTWHVSSTDALTVCGFRSWWKKNTSDPTGSIIQYFGWLPEGHTTGTIGDVTVVAQTRIPGNLITESEQPFDAYLKSEPDNLNSFCLDVYPGLTWATYYYVDTTDSDLTTWRKDFTGDTLIQFASQSWNETEYFASGDLKMGQTQLTGTSGTTFILPEFSSTTESLYSTSTINNWCDGLYSTSTLISEIGSSIGVAFCRLSLFLVAPSQNSIDTLTAKSNEIQTQFPISVVTEFVATVSSTVANTSTSSTNLSFNFGNVANTSTSFGQFTPTSSIEFLGQTTYERWVNTSTRAIFRGAMVLAIWWGLIYSTVLLGMSLFRKKHQ